MKNYLLVASLFLGSIASAQVGVGTSDPKAQLDIQASVTAGNPANTDGILIPRISQFPTTNPGADQNAMLVYLTTTDAGRTPGFYFWDNSLPAWSSISPAAAGSDDQNLTFDKVTGEIQIESGTNAKVSTIADADADTKIQVEEGADDDTIRFDVQGVERFTMDNRGRLSALNTSNSVFIGEGSGASDDFTDNRNVYIGKDTGSAAVGGGFNVAIGYEAIKNTSVDTRSISNTAIGYQTLKSSIKGYNTAVGQQAGENLRGGSNVLIGYQTGRTGNANNVAVGYQTMRFNTFGSLNTIVGNQAGNMSAGHSNTSLGSNTLAGTGNMSMNVAVGRHSLTGLENGNSNVAIGFESLGGFNNGNFNIGIGVLAGSTLLDNSTNNILIGSSSGGATLFTDSILIGKESGAFEGATATGRLVIEPTSSSTPLIGGDFVSNRVGVNVDLSTAGSLSHTLTVGGSVKVQTLLNLEPSTTPASPARGDVYYDNGTNKVRVWTGAAWENLN